MTGRLLVVDGVSTNRILLTTPLSSACYQVLHAATGAKALAVLRQSGADMVLIGGALGDMDATTLCRRIRTDPSMAAIPVVVLSSGGDIETRMATFAAGAAALIVKPVDTPVLLARVRKLLRAAESEAELALREETRQALGLAEPAAPFTPPGRIALLDRGGDGMSALRHSLARHLSDRIDVVAPDAALSGPAIGPAPDAFLIEGEPGDGMLRLLSELRARAGSRHAGLLALLPAETGEAAATALDIGVDDVAAAGAPPREIAQRLSAVLDRKCRADRLRGSVRDGLQLAARDPLTGLFNRRYALSHLAALSARACRTGGELAVMVIDLDRFKAVNDTHGHAAGDIVLTEVGERLRSDLRASDFAARIGGEEFLIALTDSSADEARTAAERVCRTIEERPVPLPGGATVSVTTSIGVALGSGVEPAETLIARADTALYAAKAEGRNRVTLSRTAA